MALPNDYVSFEARIHRSTATVHAYTGGSASPAPRAPCWTSSTCSSTPTTLRRAWRYEASSSRLEDLDAALARADELAIEFATVPTPNRAIVTGGSANRWAGAGQTEWFLDHFADGFTATLANGSAITRDELVSGAVAPAVLGFGGTDRRAIAAMSDRLSLLYVGADDGTAMWSVEEVDHTGRLTRIRQFDEHSIVDAANHRDAVCCRTTGTTSRPGRMPQPPLLKPTEHATLPARCCSPPRVHPRRPTRVRLLDPIDRQRSSTCCTWSRSATPRHRAGAPAIRHRGSRSRPCTRWVTPAGCGRAWSHGVMEHRQGQVVRLELFHDGDLDAAMARFHELGAGFDPVGSFTPHIDEIQTRGDVDTFIALLHPAYQIIDHRPFGWEPLDVDGMKERTKTLSDLPGEVVVHTGRVHVLESTFSFLERGYDMTRSDGSTVEDRHLMVTVVDPATGLILRSEQFGVDGLAAATARLDELRAEFPFVPTPIERSSPAARPTGGHGPVGRTSFSTTSPMTSLRR